MQTYIRISTTNGLLARGIAKLFIIGLFFNVAMASAATIVPTSADSIANGIALQTALKNAQCGDEIVLQGGVSFSGNFTLPYKGACSGTSADYITIRTSDLGGIPPAGTRITPANASAMAKLVASSSIPALEAEANAHHFKLIGIEITNVGGSVVTQELVLLGARSSGGGIPFSQHPHHITFDRCWIHEATNDTTTPDSIVTTAIRGFNLNATDITITESRIAGFRAYQPVSQGVEASNDILFPNSALRVLVQNTYLEAWFCPVFFGGASGETPNTATLTNLIFDSMSHTGSATFSSVSNLLAGDLVAMKTTNGRTPSTNSAHPNELVQFQVVEVTAINGNSVSFQSWGSYDGNLAGGNPLLQLPDSPGLAQWNGYLNQDITLTRNQFVENFVSTEKVWTSTGGSPTTQPRSTQVNTGNAPKGMIEIKMAKNVLINGNTFEGWELGFTVTSRNQGNTQTSGGFPWAGVFNVTISNNWWKKTQNWDRIYSFPIGGPQLEDNEYSNMRSGPFTFSNNLVESGVGPILAAMGAADNVTLTHNTYPGSDVPPGGSMVIGQGADSSNFVFVDNILSNNEYGRNCQSSRPCWPGLVQNHNVILDNRSSNGKIGDGPLNSRYPNDFIAANQSAVGWVDPLSVNYALANSSPYKGKASDATDPGVDMDALLAALGGISTPPAVTITNPTNGSTVSDTAAVSAAVTGNISVSKVEFYVDGQLNSSSYASPYTAPVDTRVLPNGGHAFTAKAYDPAGYVGSSSVSVNVNNADVTSPMVSITSPLSGATLSGTITVTAPASDNMGVTRVEFFVDTVLVATSTGASPFTATVDTKTLSNSGHSVFAKAYDAAGNIGSSASISFTVNNTDVIPPTISTDAIPPTISITSPLSGTLSGTITMTASASDNVGVTRVEFLVDNVVVATSVGASPFNCTIGTTRFSNGLHNFGAKAYDAAGNSGISNLISLTVNNVDMTPPTTTITSPGSAATVSSTVTLSATASDNVGVTRVEFLLDNIVAAVATTSPYVQALDTTKLTNSSHVVKSRAYDVSGNVGTSADVSIYVNNLPKDTTVPTVTLTSTMDSKGVVTLLASATDNVAITRVEFYVDGKLNGADTAAPFVTSLRLTGPSGSNHTAVAKAYDAAGNVGTSSSIILTKK